MCQKPDDERDFALVAGQSSLDELATLYGVSRTSLHQHVAHVEISGEKARAFRTWMTQRRNRPGAAIEKRMARLDESAEAAPPSQGQILHRLYLLEGEALGLLQRAKQQDAVRDAVSAIRAAESLLVRISELSGFLRTGTDVNVGVVVADAADDEFDAMVRQLATEMARRHDAPEPSLLDQAESCLRMLTTAGPDSPEWSADERERVTRLVEWCAVVVERYGTPGELVSGVLNRYPGGPTAPHDGVDDAEVVSDAEPPAEAQATPQRALPPACRDGCGCWRCAGKPKPSYGIPGPTSVGTGGGWR